jgi:predicted nucleic acid-binding protein
MTTFALDTNIVSFLLRGDERVLAKLQEADKGGNAITIPPLVYYEVKRGLLADNSSKRLQSFEYFYEDTGIGEMTLAAYDEAARQYARLRRIGTPVEDADLLIAACCIENGYTLVTHNTKHFERVDGLTIADWAE